MAQSYDRRINLYINIDGKEIKNNAASIRAEMDKIINKQRWMTIGSKEYQEATAKIKYLKAILEQHRMELSNIQKSWSFKGIADGFNRYMGIMTAFAASATGLILSFKQIISTFNDYEERVDNLSALTGLAGDDLEWLSNKAKELSTSTLEGGIRVTQSAKDIIDAFTKTGSARPELLKNKEALVEVTKEAIILSDAAKIELQPAIEALTMVMNQYNVGADQARRIINMLAAGSKEGAGEIPYLTTAFEKAGTVASLADISIESLGAAIETLAPRITQPEIAGRSLKGVLLDLQTGADDTNPAVVGLSTAIENLGKKNLSVTELTKKFGTENINTAQILIKNVDELKKYEAAMTGTNVAIEQASINTDNNNAKLAQARNRLNVMSIELGEKLAPALQVSTSGLSYLVKGLSVSIDFFTEHKAAIVGTLAALVAYNVATKAQAIWMARANKESFISITLGKLQALAYNAQFAGIALYNTALALLKGNLAAASVQFRAFSAALMANPVGLIVGAVVGLGVALYTLSGSMTAAQKAQKMLNDVNLQAQKNIVEEKIKVQTLLDLAKNENLTKTERLKAIQQLNAISPKYLSGLTLENINTKTATQSVKDYTDAILENARAQAAKEKLIEIEKQLLDLQNGQGAEISMWQGAWNAIKAGGNTALIAANNADAAAKNLTKRQEELTVQKEKLLQITQKQAEEDLKKKPGGEDPKGQDLIKLKEKELADIQAEIAITPQEIASRNQRAEAVEKELNALRELGTSHDGDTNKKLDDAAIKKRIEQIEAGNNAEMAAIKKRHLEGKTNEDQYNAELLQQELKFLADKAKVYKVGSKEYEDAQMQLLEKQVTAEKAVKDLILKANNELANAKIANLQDGIEKEKAVEQQRWDEELQGLKKQLIEKENLSADEIALNDAINKTIEEKQKAHNKTMDDIDKAEEIRKQQNMASKFGGSEQLDTTIPFVSLHLLQTYFDERKSLLEQQYEFEKKAANGNAKLITQIEEKYADKRKQLAESEANAIFDMTTRKIEIGQAYLGALGQIFGQESALGKALFAFSQALAIADVWIKTAKSNASIYATALAEFAFLGPGAPAAAAAFAAAPIAANNTYAALQTGLIATQTVASFVAGHEAGGYAYEEQYVIAEKDKPEWVAPNWMVEDPYYGQIIAGLDQSRKNRTTVSSGAYQASASYASTRALTAPAQTSDQKPTVVVAQTISPDDIKLFSDAVKELTKYRPEIDFPLFKKQEAIYNKVTGSGLK